jgi:hypothetical protein
MSRRRRNEQSLIRREFIQHVAGLGLAASGAGVLLSLPSCAASQTPGTSISSLAATEPPSSTAQSAAASSPSPAASSIIPPMPTTRTTTPTLPSFTGSLEEPLPQPVITGTPVELCLNSRYSEHNLTGTAGIPQIASVLWAMGKAPVTGDYWNITVITSEGTYAYNPSTHALIKVSAQRINYGAFMVRSQSELYFDDGVAYTLATLAAIAQWKSGVPSVSSCVRLTDLYFGVQNVRGLNTDLAARSSFTDDKPGWLPDPDTKGKKGFEDVLAHLNYTASFTPEELTRAETSQLLWSGYGCTPHMAIGSKRGLTVPSAVATYYLTGTIYLVDGSGVFRYQNR